MSKYLKTAQKSKAQKNTHSTDPLLGPVMNYLSFLRVKGNCLLVLCFITLPANLVV